jgi:hypothetical protein
MVAISLCRVICDHKNSKVKDFGPGTIALHKRKLARSVQHNEHRTRLFMPEPQFRLGQPVTFARPTLITPHGRYEVVRIYPIDGLDQRYSIKSEAEPYERVVRQADLAAWEGPGELPPHERRPPRERPASAPGRARVPVSRPAISRS